MKKVLLIILTLSTLILILLGCSKVKSTKSNNSIEKKIITLKFMIERDKQWIFDDVQSILTSKNIKVNGKPIYIVTEKAETDEAMDKILKQSAEYAGWMPASSTHIQWANKQWYKQGNIKPIVDENYTTVFLTPTVIAMQESLAKIMGYPEKRIGWSDILKLSSAPNGWGIFGKEILNPVRFAHTHPAKSNSGLNALIAAEYAFSGKHKGLTLTDIKDNSETLKKLEETIVHYGESTSLLQNKIVEKGPKFIQYAVLYEYMVADMNKNNTGKEKVVAIYPNEGTILGDVCFTAVNSTNLDDEKKKALEEVKKILISDEIQKKGMNEKFFRPANPSIPLSDSISIANGINPAEPQITLELPKIEVIDALLNDWMTNMKKRANVLFVVDTSVSMEGQPLENVKAALKSLFNRESQQQNYTSIDNGDTLSIMTFNSDISKAHSFKGKNISEMNMILDNMYANGKTSLYDAIYKSIQEHYKIKLSEKENKINMIVFLTDGTDTASTKNFNQLIDYIHSEEGKLPVIITIGYGEVNEKILQEIADKTGGKYFKGTPDTIKQVFEEIKTFF